ncbi:MAG: OmpA family protein [Bacteroidales bacterium]
MKQSSKWYITILMLICSFQCSIYAENLFSDSLRTRFDWSEKWYYQVQGGINYLAAENTRFVDTRKIISPSYTFSVGKRFTPIWGSRVQFMYGNDKGVYYNNANSPMFSFRHYGIIAEGTFNFSNLIRRNYFVDNDHKWNVELKFGTGFIHSTSYELADIPHYEWLDPRPRDNFTLYGGVEISRVIYKNIDINFEVSVNRLGNLYNGQVCRDKSSEVIGDILATTFLGIRYTIPSRKPCKERIIYINTPIPDPIPIPFYTPTPIELEEVEKPIEPANGCYTIEELLSMVEGGKSIRGQRICGIEMVHFDFDKSDIKPEFALYLDKLSTLLNNCPDVSLVVMGHTDIKGSVEYNYGLSERRSKSVMKYLNKKGITYKRMVYTYYSKLNPRTENISDYGRSVNRRVEFMILQ